MSIIPEIERQLRDAAERMAQSRVSRALHRSRGWGGRFLTRPLIVGLAIVSGATGVALAARALVGVGTPAPREFPNLRVRTTGTRLLSLRVPDPAGGPPWGVRLIFASGDRHGPDGHFRGASVNKDVGHWGCVQIGRVVDGKLGVLGQDGAFHDDGLFHELPVQPESCGSLDRAGRLTGFTGVSNIEAASGYLGLEGCVIGVTRREWAAVVPALRHQLADARAKGDRVAVAKALKSLAIYRRTTARVKREPTCPLRDMRHIAFGIAGPHARSVTVTGPGINETVALSPADEGAYLVVQDEPMVQQTILALKTENLTFQALTLHETVHYEGEGSCRASSPPACLAPLGSVHAGPRPPSPIHARESDEPPAGTAPATPNPVIVTPAVGGPRTIFRLSFRGLLDGGGLSYAIKAGASPRCQQEAELAVGDAVAINVVVSGHGEIVTKTLTPPRHGFCPGDYRVQLSYSNPESGSPEHQPFATADFVVAR